MRASGSVEEEETECKSRQTAAMRLDCGRQIFLFSFLCWRRSKKRGEISNFIAILYHPDGPREATGR